VSVMSAGVVMAVTAPNDSLIKALTSRIAARVHPSKTETGVDKSFVGNITSMIARAKGIARARGLLTNESLENYIIRMIAGAPTKRARENDGAVGSGKRFKASGPVELRGQPSGINDPDTALVAMSLRDDSKPKVSNSDDERSSISDTPDLVTSQVATIDNNQGEKNYSSGIYCTPSLGRYMQCDTCLGAGVLPIPPSARLTALQHNIPIDQSPVRTPMPANGNDESSSTDESEYSLIKPSKDYLNLTENDKRSDHCWMKKIHSAEHRLQITHDDRKSFPQRIDAIERKLTEHRRMNSAEVVGYTGVGNGAESSLEKVLRAEQKWGLSPEIGLSFAQRVKMIEEVAVRYDRQLDRCLWYC